MRGGGRKQHPHEVDVWRLQEKPLIGINKSIIDNARKDLAGPPKWTNK